MPRLPTLPAVMLGSALVVSSNAAVAAGAAAGKTLFATPDAGNVIYRISYQAKPTTAAARENLK